MRCPYCLSEHTHTVDQVCWRKCDNCDEVFNDTFDSNRPAKIEEVRLLLGDKARKARRLNEYIYDLQKALMICKGFMSEAYGDDDSDMPAVDLVFAALEQIDYIQITHKVTYPEARDWVDLAAYYKNQEAQ